MTVADGFTVAFVCAGALFFFAGWVGLQRFPDALSRLHALSKADNLGLGMVVIGLMAQASWPFGVLKLLALWLVGVLVGGATSQMLAGAIHARAEHAGTDIAGEPSVAPPAGDAEPIGNGKPEAAG
jgi:multicomponent Na+:H+ antiporter subunit G